MLALASAALRFKLFRKWGSAIRELSEINSQASVS